LRSASAISSGVAIKEVTSLRLKALGRGCNSFSSFLNFKN